MREHAGGPPMIAFDADSMPHPVVGFDFDSIEPTQEISDVMRAQCEALVQFCAIVKTSKKPLLTIDQIAWRAGLYSIEGIGLKKLADSHGISKQAFAQGADRLCQTLFLRHGETMRGEDAKEKMSLRNYRKPTNERQLAGSDQQLRT